MKPPKSDNKKLKVDFKIQKLNRSSLYILYTFPVAQLTKT